MLGTIIAILAILAAAFAWSLCKVAGDGTREEERQEQIDRKDKPETRSEGNG